MNFDATEVSLLALFSLVVFVEFSQSSVCTVPLGVVFSCQLKGPGQNHFSSQFLGSSVP